MSYRNTLEELQKSGNLRHIPQGFDPAEVVDMTSNDYLGLAHRTDLQELFLADEANRRMAMTAVASRLLASNQDTYLKLEDKLENLYSKPALLFNSGYHANTGLISALASEPGTLIVADKLVHASMIDGITLSKAPFTRFVHNDFNRLEKIIAKEHDRHERIIVAVESVYSMDGDSTDIDALTQLKERYPKVMLYVDEAHAFGVSGERGLGMCHSHEKFELIDVVVGTFGKAAASAGAFCVTNRTLKEYAVNKSRSLIFSTALPPMNCAWTELMIDTMLKMDNERAHLKKISALLHEHLTASGIRTGSAASHIQPVITGDANMAVALSGRLEEQGFKVLPIRTPTVPPGTERLRISLNATLTEESINRFANTIRSVI